MTDEPRTDQLPAPLLGCLFCHAEGTIIQSEGRRFFGIGEALPTLTCNNCGCVAVLEVGNTSEDWRIRYRKYSREREYHFATQHLGKGGWLEAEDALELSRLAYIQRHRVQQARQGDLSWLKPVELAPPPPIVNPDETIFLHFRYATLRQGQGTRFIRQDDNIIDSGAFYVTGENIHLLGQKRNWSHPLSNIRKVDFNGDAWLIYLQNEEIEEYFRGDSEPEIMDAQLIAAIVQALRGQAES